MKLTTVFIIATCLQVSAKGYSQKVTLNQTNAPLQKVFEEIRKQTGYQFFYADEVVATAKNVTVNVRKAGIEEALDLCFQDQQLTYTISENTIIVKRKVIAPEIKAPPPPEITAIEIKGKITDEKGQPLEGATILVKGTNNGTKTDANGNFSINAEPNSTLIISYVGYESTEVKIGNQANVSVQMKPSIATGDLIVVVGYGSQRKSDVVSSVASVNVGKATLIPTTNVAEMLRGQVAGAEVRLGSARPGGTSNIQIRGNVSLLSGADNGPLIVLDGFPIANINDINPDDIASIELLKDASSQAIYGSRAAKGVVLVTTKRGKSGKMKIDFHSYVTTQKLTRNFDLFAPEEYAQLKREARRTDNNGVYLTPDFNNFGGATNPEWINYSKGNIVNWESILLKKGRIYNNTLSVSGGNENSKIFASGAYFNQDGLILGSGYKRGSFRVNLDQKISRKLSLQANVNYFADKQKNESTSLDFITISPFAVPYDSAGNLVQYPLGSTSTFVNPLWNMRESKNDRKANALNINAVVKYDITNNFSYRLNTLLARNTVDHGRYVSSLHSEGLAAKGIANLFTSLTEEYLIENILNYDFRLNENHNFAITGVHAINQVDYSQTNTRASGFPNNILGYDGISNASSFSATRDETRQRNLSFMGRVRYAAYDKYLLTLTGRYDGASRFAAGNKWAFFPAIAVAWKINKEGFLNNKSYINELKLRVSYGSVGNQAISPYRSLGLATAAPYIFNGVYVGGNIPGNQLPNPNLTWETSKTFNIGLDYGFFNNRLSGAIEYYKINTTDLLTEVRISAPGYNSILKNGGETENKGIEVLLKGEVIRKKDLNVNVTATWASNKNTIVKTGLTDVNGKDIDDLTNTRFIGKSVFGDYRLQFDGIFQTQAEIDASAQRAQPGVVAAKIGEIKIKDINGDGKIDNLDQFWRNFSPKWFGSISTTVNYKGIELFVDWNFVEGPTRYNVFLSQGFAGGALNGNNNGIKRDYYTPEKPSNTAPRPTITGGQPRNIDVMSTQDASYNRLRTLSLGYNLPRNILSRIGIANLKVYFIGTNVLTNTEYKSYNPENNPGDFPDAKSWTFGIKIGL